MVPTIRVSAVLAAALVLVTGPALLRGQVGSAGSAGGQQVSGSVVREGDAPLAFARVTLIREGAADSVRSDVLASADGRFVLRDVAPGAYRLVVRQIGFRPVDAPLVVGNAAPAAIALRMERLAIALPEFVVAASALSCTDAAMLSGRDDPRLEVLRVLLVENSASINALLRAYPIEVQVRRRTTTYDTTGAQALVATDSAAIVASPGGDYQPGTVLQPRREGRRLAGYRVNIPAMGAIGSAAFQRTHCFAFGGEDVVDGRRTLRLLVAPDGPALRVPDVAGTFHVDAETGILRRSELTLTNVPREASLGQVTLTTVFAEPIPGMALRVHTTNEQQLLPGSRLNGVPVAREVEVVETSGFRFVNVRPDGAPAYVRFPSAAAP
jgi:hypothetical protein